MGQIRHSFSFILFLALTALSVTACGTETRTRRGSSSNLVEGGSSGGSSGGSTGGGAANFAAARAVLNNRCAECHDNFLSMSEAQFVSLGYVVAGFPGNSQLFQRIRGAGVTPAIEDMPDNRPVLTTSEINTLRVWIEGL